MSNNYSVTPDSVDKFLEATAKVVNTTSNHVAAIQKIVNGYSVDSAIVSNNSMNDAALRNKLNNLQLQIDDIRDTIREIQSFCDMVRDILVKERLLSSEWQKDAPSVTDDFKNLEGVL